MVEEALSKSRRTNENEGLAAQRVEKAEQRATDKIEKLSEAFH